MRRSNTILRTGGLAALLTLGAAAIADTGYAAPPIRSRTTPGQIISLAAYPNALCNDNTPGVYYFRPSTTGSTRWLFYLEGGDECYDDTTCLKTRTNSFGATTSTGFTESFPQGILSADSLYNPTFYDANVVKVHYCSSDYWSGGKLATTAFLPGNADSGWSFEGRAIAVAAMTDLAAHASTNGFNAMTDILLTGSSAGGLGIVYIINDLGPLIPKAAFKLIAVDAGFSLQINSFAKSRPPTYLSTYNPFSDIVAQGSVFWNGHGNSNCWAKAVTQDEQNACYDTSQMLGNSSYVTKRAFIAESQLDNNQLNQHNFKGTVGQDVGHMTYATEFADAMKAALQAVVPPNAAFSPQRLTHDFFATNAEFTFQEQFGSTTLSAAQGLAAWYASPSTPFAMYGDAAGLP